jgi:apolipoprotein N-acyltransferase
LIDTRPFWVEALLAMAAGAVAVLAFAPFYAWPIAVVSLVVLFSYWVRATSPGRAALVGFFWGLGLFLVGVPWLYVSLHTYGSMPAPLAALAILLFCVYLSLFPALAGYVQAKLPLTLRVRLLLLMPAAFVAAEMFRGWFVTGFPWLILGYSQTPSAFSLAPLAGYAPVFGVFGISFLLALTAGAIVLGAVKLSGAVASAMLKRWLAIGATTIWAGGVLLGAYEWSSPSGAPIPVSLAQGNVPQDLKWREDQAAASLENYLQLVEQSRGKLIVLPETALPFMLQDVPRTVIGAMAEKARAQGGDVLLGVALREDQAIASDGYRYYNGAVAFGSSPAQQYAKHHLVAFGEFVPPLFSWVYQWLKMPLGGFTPGAERQPPMRLAGHNVAVNICYEDAFGAEIAGPLPAAELLVNLSNMAWFGTYLAADQHAQFSQMRAIETARWVVRSTNTGLTAAINEKGRIVASLPQFSRGVLEVLATPMQGATPYSRWKDLPMLLLLGCALGFGVVVSMRRRSKVEN